MAKIINFRNEPIVGCPCGCNLWRLITIPDKDKIPRKVVAFECIDCGERISTDINMGIEDAETT